MLQFADDALTLPDFDIVAVDILLGVAKCGRIVLGFELDPLEHVTFFVQPVRAVLSHSPTVPHRSECRTLGR